MRLPTHPHPEPIQLEDDSKEKLWPLIEHRIPWLIFGLIGGMMATIFTSHFEAVLSSNIKLAYFIPVIVYMADAFGTQTETIYVRNMSRKGVKLSVYLFKETVVGLSLGLLFACIVGFFAYYWFWSIQTAFVVGLAMFLTCATAPVCALVIPSLLQKIHRDPALGAGPFTTVVQDLLSLLIYFGVASAILLR